MRNRALICGVSGQDGAYLAKFLLEKGYEVCGTSRDASNSNFAGLIHLDIRDKIKLVSLSTTDFRSIIEVLRTYQPEEIYNLSGQSSVGLSFDQPLDTFNSIALGTLNLLEAIRFLGIETRLYNAGSIECFGNADGAVIHEESAFRPRSPYAVAKSASHWTVRNYRESYGIYACSGILSNHESPLRPERFVTRKIVQGAVRIAKGKQQQLSLGSLHVVRDWGWAPEYVDAMWRMLQQDDPEDFVIATGVSYSLKQFVIEAFNALDLDWTEFVVEDQNLKRPSEVDESNIDPTLAETRLGWRAVNTMPQVVRLMVAAEKEM